MKYLRLSRHSLSLRGSVLAYGLIIMFAVAIIMTSIIGFVASQTRYALQVHAREQAFQIAESGVQFYRWYLAHQVDGRTAQQVAAFWTTGSPYGVGTPYEKEYVDPQGSAVGRYKLEVTPPDPGSTIVNVRATGWTYRYPSDIRVIDVRFRRPSWSESAVLANDFMRFGIGTEVFGEVHSNQGIRFDGVAHNIVTSSVATYDDPDHTGASEFGVHTHVNAPPAVGTNDTFRAAEAPPSSVPARADVFQAGRNFPVATVDFNGVLGDLNLMKAAAQTTATYFTGTGSTNKGTHIRLQADGTFQYRQVKAFNTAYSITSYNGNWATKNIPNNGVIFVESNAWVEGTINNKRVTVVAADLAGALTPRPSVYILNDIRYTNTDGRDIIGIIGQNNIEIAFASESDLRIDGALLAQQGRVGREHYIAKGYFPDSKAVITINGAIATNQRYGFSWSDGTGYQVRNLYYDNNLLYYPPPYFPTGTQYEMDLWQEE